MKELRGLASLCVECFSNFNFWVLVLEVAFKILTKN